MNVITNLKNTLKSLPIVGDCYRRFIRWRNDREDAKNRIRLQRYGVETIAKVQNALRNDFPWFVEFGTLLGIVRDGGFMKYDDDVDLAVLMEDGVTPGKLLKRLLDNGFKYLSCYEYLGRIEQLAVSYKGLRVDFFLNWFIDDNWMCYHDFGGQLQYEASGRISLECFETPRPRAKGWTTISFKDMLLPAPSNFTDLLAAEYGDNWRIPDPHWNPATDKKYPRRTLPGRGYCLVPVERVYELG